MYDTEIVSLKVTVAELQASIENLRAERALGLEAIAKPDRDFQEHVARAILAIEPMLDLEIIDIRNRTEAYDRELQSIYRTKVWKLKLVMRSIAGFFGFLLRDRNVSRV